MSEAPNFWPSDQSDAFAFETANFILELAEKRNITFEQAAKAAEIGVRAQHVDMLYRIGTSLIELTGCLSDVYGSIPQNLSGIAQTIGYLSEALTPPTAPTDTTKDD